MDERYVYHEVSNEVEQYECYYDTEECCELFDNEGILNRLNQQDKRIKELEEQLKNCIKPKFNRQEHIYCVAFGEIREFVVVAYLDNNITLCEDTTTSKLEWCDNKFLVLTKEEAEAKLKELEKQDGNQ